MPRGLGGLAVAAIGSLALAVGLVALVNGRFAGALIVLGGAVLIGWSVLRRRR